jgi:hypothetical protein
VTLELLVAQVLLVPQETLELLARQDLQVKQEQQEHLEKLVIQARQVLLAILELLGIMVLVQSNCMHITELLLSIVIHKLL